MAVVTAAAIALGVPGPAGASLAGPSDDGLQAAVELYASGVHATYEASLASATALDEAIGAFVADPTDETPIAGDG